MSNSSEPQAGPVQEPCPCDNLKYGPPDANGRRSIFVPETAWADEPVPPMPRDYGMETARAEGGKSDQNLRLRHNSLAPYPGARTKNGGQQMPTNDDVYPLDQDRDAGSTFLGESSAGGPFGDRTLAQLGMIQLPDGGAAVDVMQAGAGDAALAVADMLGAKLAATFMASYLLATKGKDWCEESDFAAAWTAMLDGTREDCAVLNGADQLLCNVRNNQKDEFEATYKLVGLTSKGAWYWEVRRKFIETCKERKAIYDQTKKK